MGGGSVGANPLAALNAVAGRFSDEPPRVDMAGLRRRYSALEAWPQDAQLGLFVLSWALGPGFALAGFREAVNRLRPDFRRAGQIGWIEMSRHGSSFLTLGEISRVSFGNGQVVVAWNLPDLLYWPLDLTTCEQTTLQRRTQ